MDLSVEIPAHVKGTLSGNAFAVTGSAEGFRVLTHKGRAFFMEYDGYSESLGENTLDVVILASNPNKSKVYYGDGFEASEFVKPTCYSSNGTTPSDNADAPQSKKCAICPHNQWGSRITDKGGKGKACSDSVRLCVTPFGSVGEPMLLKVTAYALKTLGQYGAQLSKRGVDPKYIVTQLAFDPKGEYASLTFKAVRFIEEGELKDIDDLIKNESETIDKITGVTDTPIDNVGGFPITPKKKELKEEVVKEVVKAEKAPVKDEPKPEVKKELLQSKVNASVEDYDDIEQALDNLDFDD